MQYDTARQLNRIMLLAQHSSGGLTNCSEGFRKDIIQCLALCKALFKFYCLMLKFFI